MTFNCGDLIVCKVNHDGMGYFQSSLRTVEKRCVLVIRELQKIKFNIIVLETHLGEFKLYTRDYEHIRSLK